MERPPRTDPAKTPDSGAPARVPRTYAGPPTPSASKPEPKVKRELGRNPMWNRLLVLVGAAAAISTLLVVPGILNQGGKNPIAEAAQATLDSPGVRATMSGEMQSAFGQMTMSGSGVMNGDSGRAAMSLTMSGTLVGQSQRIQMDEVVDHLDVYMHAPALTGVLGTDKSWVLLRVGEIAPGLSDRGGATLGSGISSESSPTATLEALKSASDNVREIGPEQIAGIPTTHYSADVDLDKVLSDAGASGPIADAVSSIHASEMVDVWIDAQGLVRREYVNVGLGTIGTFRMTVDFSDYGIHPQVDVPPSSDVYDTTQLLQGLQHQLGG